MANPPTAAQCFMPANPGDPALKHLRKQHGIWECSVGGSGTIDVFFFGDEGEIEGSAQTGITITTEVGILGIPGLVVPLSQAPPQTDLAESLGAPLVRWMEIIARSGSITTGMYGLDRDQDGDGLFIKEGTHLTYALEVGMSRRIGPHPGPEFSTNGAEEVDRAGGILFINGTLAAPVTHGIVKASPGIVRSVFASNANAALRYLQFFDRVADLAGGETPILSFPIPPSNGYDVFDAAFLGGGDGQPFVNGIVYGLSTTYATYTAATAGDHAVAGYYL